MRLAIRDSGGEGKPIVLVHGLGIGLRSWDRVAPRLSTEGFRVVTYDQRGHGSSDVAGDYSSSAFAEDLALVSEELGLEKPIMVGHSLGATIALGYAASHEGCADWESIEAQMSRPLLRLSVWAMKVARLGTKLSFDELRRVVEEHEDVRNEELDDAYRRVTCPILMVMGTHADPAPQGEEIRATVREGVRDLQQRHPRVKVEWLSCGHNVPLERSVELVELIVAFAR